MSNIQVFIQIKESHKSNNMLPNQTNKLRKDEKIPMIQRMKNYHTTWDRKSHTHS